jgi:hypothetical protein
LLVWLIIKLIGNKPVMMSVAAAPVVCVDLRR